MPIVWRNEKRRVDELVPAPYNPRYWSEEETRRLTESITKFDLADPILINTNNTIIGGHFRLKILKEKGVHEVDVRVPDRELTLDEEKELNLRLNKNMGDFDYSLLKDFDEDMLKMVGFESDELDKVYKDDTEKPEEEAPEVRQTEIILGDMFKLGNHILLCGDSTKRSDIEKLMGTDKAEMIHTDPPYNVNYGANKNHPTHKIRSIINDKMSTDEWSIFCHSLFEIFKEFNNGDIYMWGASGPEGMRMRLWLIEMGCHWSATIIWKKQQLVLSPAKYQRMYEPCFYGWFDKSSFNADRKQTEVWEIDRPHDSKLHPTMKPIELCKMAIENSSLRGGIVLDLFGGSGSTLIACEDSNRRCRMVELDPKYVQVIIDRWEKHTGKKAEKIV